MIYKWLTAKGTVLGLVTVPDRLSRVLDDVGTVQFVADDCKRRLGAAMPADPLSQTVSVVTIRTVRRPGTQASPPDVFISGTTPEELEATSGFGFAPGAAYLRSIMDGG